MDDLEISASDMIPSDLQEKLMAIGGQGDTTEWDLGDLAVEYFDSYWDDIHHEISGLTKKAVYNAIGQFCNRAGETIRQYERVSRNVDKTLREEFDMMGRHHHRVIIPYSKGDTERHRTICLWALQQSDQYGGNLIPVHALAAALKDTYGPAPEPAWRQRLLRIRTQLEKLIDEPEAPPAVQECARMAYANLADEAIAMEGSVEDVTRITEDPVDVRPGAPDPMYPEVVPVLDNGEPLIAIVEPADPPSQPAEVVNDW